MAGGSAKSGERLQGNMGNWPRTRHVPEASALSYGVIGMRGVCLSLRLHAGGWDTVQPERPAHGDILPLTQPNAPSRAAPKWDSGQAGV